MSLVFSAFVPHPPHLLDETKDSFSKTAAAFEFLCDEWYLTQPETAIIISPHGQKYSDAFGVCAHPTLTTNLRPFGDAITRKEFATDMQLSSHIVEACKKEGIKISALPQNELDYASAVPLLLLHHEPHLKVLVIHPPRVSSKEYIDFGYVLKGVIMQTNTRVALLATGDLSHRLTTASPGGFHKDAEKFEKKIKELINTSNTVGLLSLDPALIKNAATCAYEPLLILFGVLGRMKTDPQVLAYEAVNGVGYMTVSFPIQ